MMNNPQPHQISIDFLSWVNSELRKEIERQETHDREERFNLVDRVKTYLVAGLSSASMIVLSFWN